MLPQLPAQYGMENVGRRVIEPGFLAMLGIGILQNPMFGDGTPGGLAYAFPDYGAGRVVIDGAFSAGFHAWGELALAGGWLAVLALAVTLTLRRLLGDAS